MQKLCKQCDVLIDPYRPGVMERLNLGPEQLLTVNPQLIYARLTGFGQTGPLSLKAGHDINYVGLSGILSFLGRRTEKPTAPVNLLADFAGGGLLCAFGICAALYERQSSNKGQIIDASMTEGTSYVGSWLTRTKSVMGWTEGRGSNLIDTGRFFYDTYETKDGKFMSVGAIEPKFYKNFLKGLGLKGIDQFEENENSVEIISSIFKTRTQAEWVEIFEPLDACVFPVLEIEEAHEHPQNEFRKSFLDKTVTNGIVVPNPAPRLSRTPGISGVARNVAKEEYQENVKKMLYAVGYKENDLVELQKEDVLDLSS